MKRKTLFFLLELLFLVPLSLHAGTIFRYGNLYYEELTDYEAAVLYLSSDYDGTTVTIPPKVYYNDETYTVTIIRDNAFHNCSGLTSVIIPERVRAIGKSAFCGCTGLTSITIPESVWSIGMNAFENCSGLTSITIPEGVTYIGDNVFQGCSGLTSITIPESITSIGDNAFSGCIGLTSVTIPESVTSIGDNAFSYCTGLTSVTIPASVTSIGNSAFYNCFNIVYYGTATGSPWGAKSINGYVEGNLVYKSAAKTQLSGCGMAATGEIIIPESVTSIGNKAFYGCTGLTSITIPESVTSIGNQAFSYCMGLTSITIPESVTSIGNQAFYDVLNIIYYGSATGSPWGALNVNKYAEGYLLYESADKTELLDCNRTATGEIVIPESVTSIGDRAFSYCTGLTSITIPESVISIGYHAFDGTPWYESQPDGVVYINDMLYTYKGNKGTMSNCDRYINVKKGTKRINQYAFYGCTGLTSITIPESVTSIGKYAFYGCTGLTSITIPEGVTYIGDNAFRDCTGLTSITIPESVTSIGDDAFYNCTGLTRTYYTGDIAGWCNIDFDAYTSNPIVYSHNLFLEENWWENSAVTDLVIPNGVTSIKNFAFDNCTALTSVIIPKSVTSIGESAFYGCTGLTSITCKAITPPAYGYNAFYKVSAGIPVNIPCGTISAYQNADRWNGLNLQEPPMPDYAVLLEEIGGSGYVQVENRTQNMDCNVIADILVVPYFGYHFVQWSDGDTSPSRTVTLTQDITLTAIFAKDYSGKCGDNLYWQYKDNELYITGSGAMYDYTETTQPWLLLADSIHTIYTDNTATSIGEYAFANLSKLTKLHLGAGMETIEANAFAGCLRLGNIHSYAALPPLAEESSFANYNARLYVPCEVLGDYQLAIVFGNFKYIDCISSDGVDVPNNTVTVTPSYEDATFTWPSNGNANAYTLEITKDGVVFCTLTFNANGQLMGIAFAPSKDRNNAHAPQAAQATTNGWQFTVTGLNEGSNYAYTMTVTDNSNKVLQTYEGTFTTLGGDLPEGLTQTSEAATGIQKIISDGQVLILRNGKTYTLTGQEIR